MRKRRERGGRLDRKSVSIKTPRRIIMMQGGARWEME